ncbi:MAG: hypothetical protein M0Q12_09415 [Synergistaceae bacterium]|jgi:hypothetical protein|nr:hypothetical protein [Synergistaceae bacterium]
MSNTITADGFDLFLNFMGTLEVICDDFIFEVTKDQEKQATIEDVKAMISFIVTCLDSTGLLTPGHKESLKLLLAGY